MSKNIIKSKWMTVFLLVFSIFVFPAVSWAVVPPSVSEAMLSMNTFMQSASAATNNIMSNPGLGSFIDAVWSAFAVILLVMALSKYALNASHLLEVFTVILLIVITRVMLDYFDYLTSVCWSWGEGVAGGIQMAVIGNSDPFFLGGFVNDLAKGITMSDVSILDTVAMWLTSLLVILVVALLSVCSFFCTVWALWGYALAKLIGLFFVPFIMLKRTTVLFDGWCRFFLGFLVFNIIARANLVLTVLALKCYFHIPGYTVPVAPYRLDFMSLADVLGLLAIMLISIFGLLATSRFSSIIVSGAGGFGASLRNAAYSVAYMVK